MYSCNYIKEKIVVDGKLDESIWQTAEIINLKIPVTNDIPESKTEVRLLWDNKYLYVGFKAYDKDIWSYYTEHDSKTFTEDCLEIFIQPDIDKPDYYNFEINALGTVYDAYSKVRNAGGEDCHRWSKWNCNDLKVGINIEGTINDYSDIDSYWILECAIPFKSLPSLNNKKPNSGDIWKFHVARYDYSIYLEKSDGKELSSNATLSKVDFHNVDEWEKIVFIR
ncbi:MAG: carbohydrate-binding family 9-like protein [Armatimonadota bacterium]